MPLNGSGVASKPAGTTAVASTVIESSKFNSVIDDIYSILNTAAKFADGTAAAPNGFASDTDTGFGLKGPNNWAVSVGGAYVFDVATTGINVESADAGATAGPLVTLYRNSATPAASDIVGKFLFNGKDSAGNTQEYASIETVIVDPISTTEDGQLDFYVTKAGARTKFASMTATATAFTGAASYTWDAPISVSSTAAGAVATLTRTDAGASSGPTLTLDRNSASPAAADQLGELLFLGRDAGAASQEYARIVARIEDTTAGSEDGSLFLQAMLAGARQTYLSIGVNAAGIAAANAIGIILGQLSFPATQNPSSDVNTLDDYEEVDRGTLGAVTSGSGTITTVGTKEYWHTKIGREVTLNFTIIITTNGSGATSILAAGLPFAAVTSAGYVAIGTGRANAVSGKQLQVLINSGGTSMTIFNYDNTYPGASGETLVGTITYMAAN